MPDAKPLLVEIRKTKPVFTGLQTNAWEFETPDHHNCMLQLTCQTPPRDRYFGFGFSWNLHEVCIDTRTCIRHRTYQHQHHMQTKLTRSSFYVCDVLLDLRLAHHLRSALACHSHEALKHVSRPTPTHEQPSSPPNLPSTCRNGALSAPPCRSRLVPELAAGI